MLRSEIFPDEVREFAARGAQVFVNISNDGWYGSSAARDQHLLQARMRAIENDRYLLRATGQGRQVSPSEVTRYLGVSTASTTARATRAPVWAWR